MIKRTSDYDLIIEPGKSATRYWQELWLYRELFFFLTWRDLLVRYKQTAVGIAWALLRPLVTTIIFTVVFGRIANLPSGNVPYPVLVFAALLPWQFFAGVMSECSGSLVGNSSLVTKVFFPRIIIPFSSAMVSALDFLISLVILALLFAVYGLMPAWQIVALPCVIVLLIMCALGVGIWGSALTALYRDFRIVIPFIIQIGVYISPVGFSSAHIPEQWRLVYSLNPMVGVIDGFRWALLGGRMPAFSMIVSFVISTLILVTGMQYFRRVEKSIADII